MVAQYDVSRAMMLSRSLIVSLVSLYCKCSCTFLWKGLRASPIAREALITSGEHTRFRKE